MNNPLYKNQGIHVIASIFTVDHGEVKVLLIKRKNEPFKDMWALVGGALYNNENLYDGLQREVKEKTGIENIDLSLVNIFGKVDRSPVMRMVAVNYIGVVDIEVVNLIKKTNKTTDADWVNVKNIGHLAYDHDEIIAESLKIFKSLILKSNILKSLFPNGFTIPEIMNVYEVILEKKFDRRNFRRDLLKSGLVEDTKKEMKYGGNKPAKVYRFKDQIEYKNVFNF